MVCLGVVGAWWLMKRWIGGRNARGVIRKIHAIRGPADCLGRPTSKDGGLLLFVLLLLDFAPREALVEYLQRGVRGITP